MVGGLFFFFFLTLKSSIDLHLSNLVYLQFPNLAYLQILVASGISAHLTF